MRYSPSLVTTLALVAAAACSSDSVTDSRTLVGLELTMSPARDTLYLGGPDSLTKSIVAGHATMNGKPVPLPGHVFESGDTAVATVASFQVTDTTAVVSAIGLGTTTVAVRVNGERATTTIVVLPILKSVTVTAPVAQVLVRDTIPLTAKAFGWDGSVLPGQAFTFTSSSSNATVSSTGVVTFTAPGSATITARSGDQIATVALTALPREFIGGGSASLSSGMDATCGLLPLGRAFCFGRAPLTGIARDTSCFDLPNTPGDPTSCTLVPLPIAANLQLTALAVGDSVACGLTAVGQAYCWGDQKYGEVGNGISKPGSSVLPVRVTGPLTDAATFIQITAGHSHACGLIAGGAAYCWGRDTLFQLGGSADFIDASSSTPIPAGGGILFKSITAGFGHTCGLRADGVAFCWGSNAHGQLGRGVYSLRSDSALAIANVTFTQISASGDNTCGVTATGTIFCWGANESGQTGQSPSPVGIATPTQVGGSGYTFVAVGGAHACALAGGTASCWGSNAFGQLGRGAPVSSSFSPTSTVVSGNLSFTALSSGSRTSCGVAAGGTYCWGSSIYGATGSQIQALAVLVPTLVAAPQ